MAYFSYKSSQSILEILKTSSRKIPDSLIKNIESTMDTLHPKFLEIAGTCEASLTSQTKFQTRLDNLKASNCHEISYDSFKSRDLISAQELNLIMRNSSEPVLLIDLRSRREFQYSHINYSAVINIEPSMMKNLVAQGGTVNDQSLESALSSTLDPFMFNKFKNRHKYDLIVLYNLRYGFPECDGVKALTHSITMDQNSKTLTSNPFKSVIDLITFKCQYLSSRVKQYPLILNGGLESWYQNFGDAGLAHVSNKSSTESDSANNLIANHQNNETKGSRYVKNFGDYFASGITQNTIIQSSLELDTSHEPAVGPHTSESRNLHVDSEEVNLVRKGSKIHEKKSIPPGSNSAKFDSISFATGLTNLGNSCYMNCVLQCLAATPPLIDFFMTNDKNDVADIQRYKQHINLDNALGSKGIVTNTFVNLLKDMFKKNGAVFTPTSFKRIVGSASPNKQFATSDQQDCIEFLNFILDSLHEDLNQRSVDSAQERAIIMDLSSEQESAREILPIRLASTIEWERYLKLNFSIVVDYFQGQLLSQLKCLECKMTSTTYNSFSILSLPIPEKLSGSKTVSLSACLELFLETELLDEDNKWHCPKCQRFTKSTKKITITRLPRILIIHFKRFKFQDGHFKKLESLVTYPVDQILDMTEYWPTIGSYMNSSVTSVMEKSRESEIIASFPLRNQAPPFKYKLYGVANHYGNLTTGHYTSYVRKNNLKGEPEWCYFDDARVSHGVNARDVLNSNAYCLFYRRI